MAEAVGSKVDEPHEIRKRPKDQSSDDDDHDDEKSMDSVRIEKGTYKLAFVKDEKHIMKGPVTYKEVPAWKLSNDKISVTMIREAACAVKIQKTGSDKNYLWENKGGSGACYYGAGTNNFPLARGVKVHGGIRAAVVTAEHGLYFDTEWDLETDESDENSKSVIFTITDTDEQRAKLLRPDIEPKWSLFSSGQYSNGGLLDKDKAKEPMSFYPTTNCKFTARITLKEGEEFVRFKMSVENPTKVDALGEAWFPMTYPITKESRIISPQRMRWKRDAWCFPNMPQMVHWPSSKFVKPLDWEMSAIFYDTPSMEGCYHAVSSGLEDGSGCAYVTRASSDEPQFTKIWSWGKLGDRGAGVGSQGRPKTDYYEPWSTAFNKAFFQRAQFPAGSTSSFEIAVLPIESGLTNDKSDQELQETVATAVAKADIVLEPTCSAFNNWTPKSNAVK